MSNTKIGLINLTTVTLNQINFKSITYSFQKLTLDCSYTKSCSKTTQKKSFLYLFFIAMSFWTYCNGMVCLFYWLPRYYIIGPFFYIFLNNILYEVCILLIVLSSIIIIIMEMWNSYTHGGHDTFKVYEDMFVEK